MGKDRLGLPSPVAETLRRINQSDRNPAKELYLGEQGILSDKNRPRVEFILGLDGWFRNTFSREGRNWKAENYREMFKEEGLGALWGAAVEGIMAQGKMALADRTANEAIIRVENDGPVGQLIKEASEHVLLGDHGSKHSRRTERLYELIINNIWFLRHGVKNIQSWLLSGFLTHPMHDLDQVFSQHRNLFGEKLDTKTGHSEAGSLMVWLLARGKLAEAGELEEYQELRSLAGSMATVLLHGRPDKLALRMHATKDAADYVSVESLAAAWDKSEVNYKTLTVKNILQLTQYIKKQSEGFVTEAAPYGLHPIVEEQFKESLKAIADGTGEHVNLTLGEMLRFVDENDQEAFEYSLEAFVISDTLDMNLPPLDSLFRSLQVPVSQGRPLIDDRSVDEYMEVILTGDGIVESDLERWAYESMNILAFPNSRIARSTYMQKFVRETSIRSLVGLSRVMRELLLGIEDTLDLTMRERRQKLQQKTQKALNDVVDGKIARIAYIKAIGQLDDEQLQIKQVLTKKPHVLREFLVNVNTGMPIYPQEYLDKADDVITRCLERLGASEAEIAEAEASIFNSPYGYDSLGINVRKGVHKERIDLFRSYGIWHNKN